MATLESAPPTPCPKGSAIPFCSDGKPPKPALETPGLLTSMPHRVCPTLASQRLHPAGPLSVAPEGLESQHPGLAMSLAPCGSGPLLHSGFLGGSCISPSGCQAGVWRPQAKGTTYKDKGNLRLPAVARRRRWMIKGGPRGEAGEGCHLSSGSLRHTAPFLPGHRDFCEARPTWETEGQREGG